jgi:hypothetical protein
MHRPPQFLQRSLLDLTHTLGRDRVTLAEFAQGRRLLPEAALRDDVALSWVEVL